jgi:exodeoxyribonuclease VII small subunit
MARKKVKFEEALERLEKIVDELEGGDLTLDESIARYEEGVKALKQCYEILQNAEKKVEVLMRGEDASPQTAPFFTPDATDDQSSAQPAAPPKA